MCILKARQCHSPSADYGAHTVRRSTPTACIVTPPPSGSTVLSPPWRAPASAASPLTSG